MDGNHLCLLSNLLNPPEEESKEQDLDSGPSPYVNPGSIGPAKVIDNSTAQKKPEHDKDIWCPEEVSEANELSFDDPRPEPKYEMVYKQDVTTEDVFLGMDNKTPLTSACENLVLRINLPNTEVKDIDLTVTNKHVDCRTPKHRLGLYLPHTVEANSSKARWLNHSNVLEVTLKVVREYDFLNK